MKALTRIFLLILSVVMAFSCRNKSADNEFVPYNKNITAFTSGVISNQSPVKVQFATMVNEAIPGKKVSGTPLKINPSVKGEFIWEDSRTLVFKPTGKLTPGQAYSVELSLGDFFPGDDSKFRFKFQVMPQFVRVDKVNLKPQNPSNYKECEFIGKLTLSDYEELSLIEKMIVVTQNGKVLPLSWEHQEGVHVHYFTASGVVRGATAGSVKVEWNGKVASLDFSGSENFEVPALTDFKIMDVKKIQTPSQQILVTFSDPLDASQTLDGLLRVKEWDAVRYTVNDNQVTLFPTAQLTGIATLQAFQGIRNSQGRELGTNLSYTLNFESPKPEVKLLGQGVIIPNSQGLVFPFKVVSARAIQVSVIKIYENNIATFLQVNRLDGNDQLRRAGKLVLKKVIHLDEDQNLDLTQWNTFSLDVATLINPDPGAIYRIMLTLKKEYAVYPCGETEVSDKQSIDDSGITDSDIEYWDTPNAYSYENWGDYDWEDYNWEEQENPCHSSYYHNRTVSRNILASNLGVVVKVGADKELVAAITDLRSTEPMADVELEVLDYQNQMVGKGKTGSEGLARISLTGKPFLVIAKKEKQRGYLRVDEGSALSVSRFDVAGQTIRKGIKGFIYGERGVWRPGDTLFVSFVLEDKTLPLPEGHPITFELINPRGQVTDRQVITLSSSRLFCFTTSTTPAAPTGMWTARVQAGGATFEQPLRIETVKPNRLKINLDFGTQVLRSDALSPATLNARWLHGATASNLKAQVNVTLNAMKTTFKGYDEFSFDDPTRTFSSQEVTVFSGKLDASGNATINPDIRVTEAAPGMLKASFFTRVFEESGDFSTDRFAIAYAPYKVFVGVKAPEGDQRGLLLTDESHSFDVTTLDAGGNPVSRSNLNYRIYKVQWRWWWESSEENLARYVGNSHQNLVASGLLSTVNGKGSFKFMVKHPDWGRFLVLVTDNQGGHIAGTTVNVDWPGWALKPNGNAQEAAMLSFSSEKTDYKVGENVKLSFPSPGQGRALISLETGSRIIKAWWVETKQGMTETSFEATPDMTPNVYVHITLIQPHNQTNNNLPLRLYGVIPVMVEDPNTHLEPKIIMPDELQPEKEVTIKIKEANGRPMSYTLAIVDDGLLDLTRFKTPDAWNHFFAREALGVRSWDIYDFVMGAYGGRIERAFSIGGDEDLNNGKGANNLNRFKPMVKFFGPVTLQKGKTNNHTFKMPRYVGSVRTMVIASQNGAYGQAEITTPVRKPLMVLGTLPRVLGPGEQVKFPVTVFAMKPGVEQVEVKIEVKGAINIAGESRQIVTFDRPGDKVVTFDLKVKEQTGSAKVTFSASSGNETATDVIDIMVRNANPPVTTFVDKVVNGGETATLDFTLPGLPGSNKAVLEVSSIPPIDFGRRLQYLLAYPHGCLEQTTSAAFPQLFLTEVVEASPQLRKKCEENVNAAIQRLKSFIRTDGGFSYWPGSNQPDSWSSSYAGHFLLEAEKKGFSLPLGWKKGWISNQIQQARRWNAPVAQSPGRRYAYLDQAYRLYTLALSGSADMSSMNRLRNESKLPVDATWRLAAAYALAGQTDVAQKLVDNLKVEDAPASGYEYDYTYGSAERNKAMLIETMSLLNRREQALPLVQQLSKSLSGNTWMSTQSTAYSLLAMSRFAGKETVNQSFKFEWLLNGISKGTLSPQKPVYQDSVLVNNMKEGQITIRNLSKGVVFARMMMRGVPATDDATVFASNLQMSIEYLTMDGKPIDISRLKQGTDFMALVKINNPGTMGDYRNIALSQVFPSGWEIRNTRMEDVVSAHEADKPDYRDFRDDRVYSYFDLRANKSTKLVVLLNATYKGSFYLPATSCEAMYDATINARQPGKWVVVE